jgi:hypothetical protein
LGNGTWLDYTNYSFCCYYLGDSQSCVSKQRSKVNYPRKKDNTISISGSYLLYEPGEARSLNETGESREQNN